MSKTSSHQKFFFFFLYDLSKGLRNGGVVSILLSSLVPSAILNDGILSCPILYYEITKYDTSFSV
jgi:hypothetical protein